MNIRHVTWQLRKRTDYGLLHLIVACAIAQVLTCRWQTRKCISLVQTGCCVESTVFLHWLVGLFRSIMRGKRMNVHKNSHGSRTTYQSSRTIVHLRYTSAARFNVCVCVYMCTHAYMYVSCAWTHAGTHTYGCSRNRPGVTCWPMNGDHDRSTCHLGLRDRGWESRKKSAIASLRTTTVRILSAVWQLRARFLCLRTTGENSCTRHSQWVRVSLCARDIVFGRRFQCVR